MGRLPLTVTSTSPFRAGWMNRIWAFLVAQHPGKTGFTLFRSWPRAGASREDRIYAFSVLATCWRPEEGCTLRSAVGNGATRSLHEAIARPVSNNSLRAASLLPGIASTCRGILGAISCFNLCSSTCQGKKTVNIFLGKCYFPERVQYENRYGSHFYENVSKDLRKALDLTRGMSESTINWKSSARC